MHKPVLMKEVLQYLDLKPGDRVLDGTLGGGGHAAAIFERIQPGGVLLGMDQDEEAVERVHKILAGKSSVIIAHGNFSQLDQLIKAGGHKTVHKVLLDLGVSSFQLDIGERGFSFANEGPLDMRMDVSRSLTAEYIVNRYSEKELEDIFYQFGEEPKGRLIARKIVSLRRAKPFRTTRELADLVKSFYPGHSRTHPATRVFQALRIAVNDELKNLSEGLDKAVRFLENGGRIAVISFHSLEDRVVKRKFKEEEDGGRLKVVTKQPVIAEDEEVAANPRARSAKLRVAERI